MWWKLLLPLLIIFSKDRQIEAMEKKNIIESKREHEKNGIISLSYFLVISKEMKNETEMKEMYAERCRQMQTHVVMVLSSAAVCTPKPNNGLECSFFFFLWIQNASSLVIDSFGQYRQQSKYLICTYCIALTLMLSPHSLIKGTTGGT